MPLRSESTFQKQGFGLMVETLLHFRTLEALRQVELPIDWAILEELFHASKQGTGGEPGEPDRWG